MIRKWDYIVVLIFSGIATFLLGPLFTAGIHWTVSFFAGMALSALYELWKFYEDFRVAYENNLDKLETK